MRTSCGPWGPTRRTPAIAAAALAAIFEAAGIRVEQSADVRRAIWFELWGNATINPLSALTRATADKLLAEPPTSRLHARRQ